MTSETNEIYDIILIAGQSNTCFGYGFTDFSECASNVWELGRYKKDMQIIPATPALYNHSRSPLKSSFGYYFAKYYAKNQSTDSKILVIGCGENGSSFIKNKWNKGDKLYDDLVYRSNFILKNYPGSKIIAILWQQGESDIENVHYQQNLDAMITHMRQDILQPQREETLVSFFLGGMVPFWTNQQANRIQLQSIIAETEKRLPCCYYVDPEGISKPDNKQDAIHYSHENQIELAKRYWRRFEAVYEK